MLFTTKLMVAYSAPKLAEQLAPVLHFHKNEGRSCCFPSDPIAFWKKGILGVYKNDRFYSLKTVNGVITREKGVHKSGSLYKPDKLPILFNYGSGEEEELYLTSPEMKEKYFSLWKRIKRFFRPDKLTYDTPCYTEIYEDLRNGIYHIQIRYWFWYPFNRHFEVGIHEGDWEHFETRAIYDSNSSDGEVKFFAYVAQHRTFEQLTEENVEWTSTSNGILENPILYSALGSHATYSKEQVLPDNTHPTHRKHIWNTKENLITNIQKPNSPVWQFNGKWGRKILPTIEILGEPPVGPNRKDRWRNTNDEEVWPT
jgi:hypothetical protein